MSKAKLDQNKDQAQEWEPSIWMKISQWVGFIGWFPFMFICAFGSNMGPIPQLFIIGLGILICTACTLISMGYTNNPVFWKSYKEVEDLKREHREFKAKYHMALNEFVMNQKLKEDDK